MARRIQKKGRRQRSALRDRTNSIDPVPGKANKGKKRKKGLGPSSTDTKPESKSTRQKEPEKNESEKENIIVSYSSLAADDAEILSQVVKARGGKVVKTKELTAEMSNVTHLVIPNGEDCKRTTKVAYGISKGIWIVHVSWIYDSLIKADGFANEIAYEAINPFPQCKNRREDKIKLFEGKSIHCGEISSPIPRIMRLIIDACGAKVTKKLDSSCELVIADDKRLEQVKSKCLKMGLNVPVESLSWFFDCITSNGRPLTNAPTSVSTPAFNPNKNAEASSSSKRPSRSKTKDTTTEAKEIISKRGNTASKRKVTVHKAKHSANKTKETAIKRKVTASKGKVVSNRGKAAADKGKDAGNKGKAAALKGAAESKSMKTVGTATRTRKRKSLTSSIESSEVSLTRKRESSVPCIESPEMSLIPVRPMGRRRSTRRNISVRSAGKQRQAAADEIMNQCASKNKKEGGNDITDSCTESESSSSDSDALPTTSSPTF